MGKQAHKKKQDANIFQISGELRAGQLREGIRK
jgi:hypothetical protein